MLTNILNNIIPIRILNQLKRRRCNLINEMSLLLTGCMVNATLENAASVAVCANDDAMCSYCIEDKLCILSGKPIKTFLNYMIAIQILDQLNDLIIKGTDNSLDLY